MCGKPDLIFGVLIVSRGGNGESTNWEGRRYEGDVAKIENVSR